MFDAAAPSRAAEGRERRMQNGASVIGAHDTRLYGSAMRTQALERQGRGEIFLQKLLAVHTRTVEGSRANPGKSPNGIEGGCP